MQNPGSSGSAARGGWTSADGGQSWTEFTTPANAYWEVLSLAVDPANPDTFYEGSADLWRVDNDGGSVTDLCSGSPQKLHVDIPSLAFDALHRFDVGTDGGLARTNDGQTFVSANGDLSITQINPGISGTLQGNGALVPGGPFLVGAQDQGVLQYSATHGPNRWYLELGGDGSYTAVDPTAPGTEYGSIQSLYGVSRTEDYFQSQTNITDSQWQKEFHEFIAPLVMDTARPGTLYVGAAEVYRSPGPTPGRRGAIV